jgi:hypothetical protein
MTPRGSASKYLWVATNFRNSMPRTLPLVKKRDSTVTAAVAAVVRWCR